MKDKITIDGVEYTRTEKDKPVMRRSSTEATKPATKACPQCNGTGNEPCASRIERRVGILPVGVWASTHRRCGRCRGSGSVPNIPDCPNCGVKGQVWDIQNLFPCPECKGSGRGPDIRNGDE